MKSLFSDFKSSLEREKKKITTITEEHFKLGTSDIYFIRELCKMLKEKGLDGFGYKQKNKTGKTFIVAKIIGKDGKCLSANVLIKGSKGMEKEPEVWFRERSINGERIRYDEDEKKALSIISETLVEYMQTKSEYRIRLLTNNIEVKSKTKNA